MIRRFIATSVATGLILSGSLITCGCSGDSGQAPRESISVPRKGGGIEDPGADPKGKGTKAIGGKLGGRRAAD